MSQTLLKTPLHDRHVSLGARMVPFAGWEMPVQYEGVIQEHRAVRTDAGVFDVSHMGEIEVEGPRAHELLQGLLSNDLDRIEPGQAQYTLLTNPGGGIVDDLIAYRLERCRYLLVGNASNRDADYRRIKEEGPERKLVAFVMEEKAIPRHGMAIEGGGEVTSGTHSPMLDVGIGMGYVPAASAGPGTELTLDVRGRPRRARIVKKPIYKRGE